VTQGKANYLLLAERKFDNGKAQKKKKKKAAEQDFRLFSSSLSRRTSSLALPSDAPEVASHSNIEAILSRPRCCSTVSSARRLHQPKIHSVNEKPLKQCSARRGANNGKLQRTLTTLSLLPSV